MTFVLMNVTPNVSNVLPSLKARQTASELILTTAAWYTECQMTPTLWCTSLSNCQIMRGS